MSDKMQKVDGLNVTTAECDALISTLYFPSTDRVF